MEQVISEDEARDLRIRAQLLARDEGSKPLSVVDVVRQMVGLQAQDLMAASLQVRARSHGLVHGDVTNALYHDRTMVRTWCLRGTLHLVAAEDVRWLLDLLGESLIGAARRRRSQLGLNEATTERAVQVIEKALQKSGPLTRSEVFDRLASAHIPYESQAGIHLIRTAGLMGLVCYGPERDGSETFVLIDDWIGSKGSAPRTGDATSELARRYLSAYGPAAHADLAWWSGLGAAVAKAAFNGFAGELVRVGVSEKPAFVLASHLGRGAGIARQENRVTLLPAFDPYLLGYKDRSLAVEAAYIKNVNVGGGMLKPVVIANGHVVATWGSSKRRGLLEVSVEPLETLPPEMLTGLQAEAADLARYIGMKHSLQIKE